MTPTTIGITLTGMDAISFNGDGITITNADGTSVEISPNAYSHIVSQVRLALGTRGMNFEDQVRIWGN